MSVSVLIVESHLIIRHGLKMALEGDEDIVVVGECSTTDEAIPLIKELSPQVAIVDISSASVDAVSEVRKITNLKSSTRVLALTLFHSARSIQRLKAAGAMGCLTQGVPPKEFPEAAKAVARNEFYLQTEVAAQAFKELLGEGGALPILSEREIDVVRLVSQGHNSNEAAKLLSITPRTAQTHLYHAMKKLDLHSRKDLIQYAINEGLIPRPKDKK